MFTLSVKHSPNGDCDGQTSNATIEVRSKSGKVVADVFVEVYEGVPRLVLTGADSDDATQIINLLTWENFPV